MKRTILVLTLTLLLFAPPVTVSAAADGGDTSPTNKVLGQSGGGGLVYMQDTADTPLSMSPVMYVIVGLVTSALY